MGLLNVDGLQTRAAGAQGMQCLKALLADQLGLLDVYEVALVDVQDLTMAQPPPSYPIRKSGGCAKFHRVVLLP